jgi:thioredoxin reductase
VFSICGNSFKTVGKAFQVKLVERIACVCKAVIKAKGAYLKNLKYKTYFDLFNTSFGYYMIPYVLFHSGDVFTIILQCIKLSK